MKNKIIRLRPILILFSILASLKMIFFALGLDEEYQLVMAYRNARGDRLFLDMWEPHQASAFLCTLLMKPYLALFGTTGIVLYLRVCGTLLHLGVSFYLYKELKGGMDSRYAWLLALIYYNTIPKQIILPEFGIMQVWFYTLTALFLAKYYRSGGVTSDTGGSAQEISFSASYERNLLARADAGEGTVDTTPCKRKLRYLVLAALALTLNILAYPSCLILFLFFLILLARFSGRDKWRNMGIVALTCGLCGVGYLGMLFTYTTPDALLETLFHILNGDVTHSLTPGGKLLSLLKDSLYMAGLWLCCLLLSVGIAKRKKLNRLKTYCLTAVFACILELFYWIVWKTGYESMQIHLVAFAMTGLCICLKHSPASKESAGHLPASAKGRDVTVHSAATESVQFLLYIMAGAALSLLAVIYLTDLSLIESVPHAMPAAFCGAVLLILALKKDSSASDAKWAYAALLVWCLTAIFGKGYTLRGGINYDNVLQSGGIMRRGPAAGIISNYMSAYIYNSDYEDWQTCLRDGDKVLIMVDQVMNLGTIQYLFKDVEISHFSVVNPTAYDERLLEYWEMYPEKFPNVIIVDCWYGELMTDPEGWLMQYIENDFGYTQINDGKYIRVYRREAE